MPQSKSSRSDDGKNKPDKPGKAARFLTPHVSLTRRFARLLLAFNHPLQLASAGTY
jgi:hypothetical protein